MSCIFFDIRYYSRILIFARIKNLVIIRKNCLLIVHIIRQQTQCIIAQDITFRPPRVRHVFVYRHKVITEVAQSRWWINIARIESTDGRE